MLVLVLYFFYISVVGFVSLLKYHLISIMSFLTEKLACVCMRGKKWDPSLYIMLILVAVAN